MRKMKSLAPIPVQPGENGFPDACRVREQARSHTRATMCAQVRASSPAKRSIDFRPAVLSLLLALLVIVFVGVRSLFAYPLHFIDASGSRISVSAPPQRVVSLAPAVTEILFRLGAGEAVTGATYHDSCLLDTTGASIVGGVLTSSTASIEALAPDTIFISSLQRKRPDYAKGRSCRIIHLASNSLADLYRNIRLLGRIFAKEERAEEIVDRIQNETRLIEEKVGRIPVDQRKRVMRFMGRDRVMAPGDDSFQNEFIRAAGGIPPQFGKNGAVVDVTLEEWRRFDPQVIYGCGGDRESAEKLLSQPGWKDVEAVRSGRIFYFPCELTCRKSVNSGQFIAWLASVVYEEQFSNRQNLVLKEKINRTVPVDIRLDYVRSAGVSESSIFDFINKTLIVEFERPMQVTSTLEGERSGILAVGNHYLPPPCWSIGHRLGLEKSRQHIYEVIGKTQQKSSFLFTGADMGNLSVQKKTHKDMTVYALVTAGVEANAVRMSTDPGRFYEPGTINVLIMANMRLTPRARTRAIISATEAKTAAMEDLDIRSCSTPQLWQATGTGTDEVLVVEGSGTVLDNAGGHCKLGELIASAVYAGVKEAVYRQNGITSERSLLRRLQERRINLYDLLHQCACLESQANLNEFLAELDAVLLQPCYASFMEAAFAISDAYERGLLISLDSYEKWCRGMAEEIAGAEIAAWKELFPRNDVPVILRMAFDAVLNGVSARVAQQ